jgi:hypothetical protein
MRRYLRIEGQLDDLGVAGNFETDLLVGRVLDRGRRRSRRRRVTTPSTSW